MSGDSRWVCGNGHVLGQVKRVRVFGQRVDRLYLYRHAVDPAPCDISPQSDPSPALPAGSAALPILTDGEGEGREVDVMALAEGAIMDVRCDICGCIRTWVPDPKILAVMVKRMARYENGSSNGI